MNSTSSSHNEQLQNQQLQNQQLVRNLFEAVVNRGDVDCVDEVLSADCVDHNPGPSDAPGRAGIREVFMLLHTAFPDLHGSIDDLLCDRDFVIVRWTIGGTNTHRCMGIGPTNRRMKNHGIDIVRVENGRIVERWGNSDDLKTLEQMGLLQDVMSCPDFNPHSHDSFVVQALQS